MSAATLYALPSTEEAEEIARERKAKARKHFDVICKSGQLQSISALKIGFHAAILKRENLFGVIGFENEDAARIASDISRSSWYSAIRIAEAFIGVEEEQFVAMRLGNAQAACDLPESKRVSREWIRMATTMKVKDFAVKVDEEMNGKARASDGKEQSVVLKMPMPASRKKSVEHHLEVCAKQLGIDPTDTGKVVEVLAVERSGQFGLMEAITNAVQLVKVAKELKTSNLSAEETLERVYKIMDEMVIGFDTALHSVQLLESEGKDGN